MTLKKQVIIWSIIATVYFISIFIPLAYYYRTTGDAPLLLIALHHEFTVLWIFIMFAGNNSQAQEIIAFVVGIVFYASIGSILGFLNYYRKESKQLRGLLYAILLSMFGYTIGASLGGHPPIFMLLSPPIFFIGGYFIGSATFRVEIHR